MELPLPDLANFPPQIHTISRPEAIGRTAFWRSVLGSLIDSGGSDGSGDADGAGALPACLHIPFADLNQVVTDFQKAGVDLSGVRLYFTFHNNNVNNDYHITGFLVPMINLGSGPQFAGLPSGLDLDYIIPVPVSPAAGDTSMGSSIYDFTLPCPTYCSGTTDDLTDAGAALVEGSR